MKELEIFFVVGNDEGINELVLNLLLYLRRSIFKFLGSADYLSELEIDVDAVESHMEHSRTEV